MKEVMPEGKFECAEATCPKRVAMSIATGSV